MKWYWEKDNRNDSDDQGAIEIPQNSYAENEQQERAE
jgi:hypothetical protein